MNHMAANSIKISDISKHFNLPSKEVASMLSAELGIEKKSSSANVSVEEFELFMQKLTLKHQIANIDAYISGETKITIRSAGSAAAPAAKPTKPAKETAAPVAKAPVETEAPAKAEGVHNAPTAAAAGNEPAAKSTNAAAASAPTAAGNNAAASANAPAQRNDRNERDCAQDTRQRPQGDQSAQNRQQGHRGNDADRRGGRDNNNRQQGADRRGNAGGYNASGASFDPFAKRRENMQRNAQGQRRPDAPDNRQQQRQGQAQQNANANTNTRGGSTPAANTQPTAAQRPAAAPEKATVAPALERQRQAEAARAAQAQAQAQAGQQARPTQDTKTDKNREKAQKQQFKTITPTTTRDVKGGVNIGGYNSDSQPRTRVVDTRQSDVNLSKYDERYNDQFYAIANGTDTRAAKQKLKKQDNRGQNQKSMRDKERAAQEKIKRMEAEKARKKQLEITVPDEITVGELAIRLKKTSAEVMKKLMFMGEMKTINDTVDYATAEIIADEFGAKVTKEIIITKEERLFTEAEDNEEDLIERAPVVCVMGHVDHGKTSILDAIRHTNVTRGEAGGITQAIGAYTVVAEGKDITFLDTPGHEAFTAMRMRGAKSTDIAILVVAADDGVMPQTVEAISHAKAAGIDIIVAINKMDKPQANPDNVLNQLTQYELVPEEWGGDVICVPVSAHTGMGIKSLLENVLLVAEVKELRANPTKRARGLVIESKLDRGRGPVATVLVQNGTLHQGDYVIVGNAVGRVRAMIDDKGKSIKSAGPSIPVEIVGLDDVPQAGDELNAVEDERMARALAEERREKQRQEILAANARVNLDELFSQISEGVKTLNIIVKADVAGSAEAVKASLVKLSGDEVKVSVIHSAVGGITESDVMLAAASNAIIVGFNVRPDKNAIDSAERNGVDIRTHRIIYEIIDEIEAAMKGMLAPTFKEVVLGHAEVRQTIRVPNVGTIAGCYVKDGKIARNAKIRIVRDGVIIAEDEISSLKRFKDDQREVAEGYECGVGLGKFNDIKEGDMFEAFIMEEVKR